MLKHIIQQGKTCLLTSLAMVLNQTYEETRNDIGTDGQQVNPDWNGWSKYPYYGIHKQLVLDYCYRKGIILLSIDAVPCSLPADLPAGNPYIIFPLDYAAYRLKSYMSQYDGILISNTHACAWDSERQMILDPNGIITNIDDFEVKEFWAFVRL